VKIYVTQAKPQTKHKLYVRCSYKDNETFTADEHSSQLSAINSGQARIKISEINLSVIFLISLKLKKSI